ncbi:GMC family oxidoreductase [Xanthobacter sediminis]
MDSETFDYVIVGAGAAGSVLADRLSADGTCTVCVIEAGPADRNPFIHLPAGFVKTMYNPNLIWPLTTEPTENTAGRRVSIAQGRVFGGSGSINGMVYNRGQPSDFDLWAALGNPGWSFGDVLPYFKRSERWTGAPDDAYRGRDGATPVTEADWRDPVSSAFIAGAEEAGIPRNPDYNGAAQEGVGYFQRFIFNGRRVSSARAHLKPALRRPNVHVKASAQVTALIVEEGAVAGVRYVHRRGGESRAVRARREVILSAGTAGTPKLLQISGIGPAGLLRALGVSVVRNLPGVGLNLRDHYVVRMVSRLTHGTTINQLARGVRLWWQALAWLRNRPSVLSLGTSLVYVFWKSNDALNAPDLQFMFTPASYKSGRVYVLDDFPAITCGVTQQRPESTGHVRARAADPFESVELQPNYLDDPRDRKVVVSGMRITRRLLGSRPLSAYGAHEDPEQARCQSDDELLDFARRTGTTGYHLVGSCKMGPDSDPLAVVDARLRLRGLERLRIVDASIMPTMPSANTYASTLMIAEKAADLILEDRAR